MKQFMRHPRRVTKANLRCKSNMRRIKNMKNQALMLLASRKSLNRLNTDLKYQTIGSITKVLNQSAVLRRYARSRKRLYKISI